MSNALLKSREITATYGLVMRRWEIVLRRWIMAAVGDPVGQKAYWSVYDRLGGGARKHDRGTGLQLITP